MPEAASNLASKAPQGLARVKGMLLAGLTMALAACSGGGIGGSADPWKVDPNRFPADYRNEIMNFLRTELADPTNIRGAFVTEPALVPFGTETRYVVCVRFNARDRDSRYEGSRDVIGIFYGGFLNQLRGASPEQCGKAAYQPFPELEQLKRLDAR